MIIQGIQRAFSPRANVTRDNIDLSSTTGANGSRTAIDLIGGQFATYEALYGDQIWIQASVNRIARGISRLPWHLYVDGGRDGERQRVRDGGLFDMLRKPWRTYEIDAIQDGNTVLLLQAALHQALVFGRAVFIKRRPGRYAAPTSLLPGRPFNWRPVWADGGGLAYWQVATHKGPVLFRPEDVWVFAPWGPGRGGMPDSPMSALRRTLMMEDAAQRAIISAFEKGGRPSGFIAFKGSIKGEARKAYQETIQEVYSGADNWGTIGLLDNDASWQEFKGQSFVDAEMWKLRQMDREEVVAAYNLPPPVVGQLDRATFSNVTEQHRMEYEDTWGPPIALLQASFQTQVIDPEPEWHGVYSELQLKALLKGDPVQEMESTVKAVGGPYMSRDEARAVHNLPPTGGFGDKVLVPRNMATDEQLASETS